MYNVCGNVCREAFSGFDAEAVAKYNEKKIISVSADYGIDLSLVRGAVDNSTRILEVIIPCPICCTILSNTWHNFQVLFFFFEEYFQVQFVYDN